MRGPAGEALSIGIARIGEPGAQRVLLHTGGLHGAAAYRIRGGMGAALPHTLPGIRIDFVLQKIGTCPTLEVLRALREENRCHYFAEPDVRHPARLALLAALNPDAPAWRRRAVVRGLSLVHAAAKWLFGERS